jgi:hypothetical protein
VTPGTVTVEGSVYEQAEYLQACAAHLGAEVEPACSSGLVLPLLRFPGGMRRTVHGLPRPYGEETREAAGELARDLTEPGVRLEAVLSPLGSGPGLARQLSVRGAKLVGERQICIAELELGERFDRRARRSIATAGKRGATTEVGQLADWFGSFYRAAMGGLDAEPAYLFGDEYFATISGLDHFVITVHDEGGIAAAALFLRHGREAYYHLGGGRVSPEPVLGAMSLALAEGIREATRSGCEVAVLGGGRSDRLDDPLFLFKRQLCTTALPRFTVTVGMAAPR